MSPDEQIRLAREQFEAGTDLTLAVEEEFALLDPATLDLVNRFEELREAAQDSPLADDLVGELISAEVEVRTGRCESFEEAAAKIAERRSPLVDLADSLGIALAATGTHPWASWRDTRIIDTPHYRRVAEGLQYVAWQNVTFVLHLHVGVQGADRAIALSSAFRAFLPELLALSASSPFHDGIVTGLHSTRSQVFTRAFPRCGVPDHFAGWREYEDYVRVLYDTGSIVEHTQIWWSVRPHFAFPTVEVRICDGQPTLPESQALSAFIYALAARLLRALDEGEPLPVYPHRLIEENVWRAIRYGLSGELIDFATGDVLPARARLEQLAEWIAPLADELGAGSHLGVPSANAAEQRLAGPFLLIRSGQRLHDIYSAELLVKEPVRG